MTGVPVCREPTAEASAAWLALRAAVLGNGPPACAADPHAWDVVDVETAQRICARCPVRVPCSVYAKSADERYGIWGGVDFERRTPSTKGKLA